MRSLLYLWLVIIVVGLGSQVWGRGASASESDIREDVIIIWSETGDQILIPLGDGMYMDMDLPPKQEYNDYVAPDFYKYPGSGYPN